MEQETVEKVSDTLIINDNKKTLFKKIKPYLIIYRNNRDIVFTLYAAIWFFFCTYVVCLANSYADRTNTNVINGNNNDYVAPDIILEFAHKFYLENEWIPRDIADLMVRTTSAFIIIRAITLKEYSFTVARRILLVMGFVYLLRACFIPLTVLPTPWVACEKTYKDDDNIFLDALLLELQLRVACGDVFFSGHTIMFTLIIMEYWYYCKQTWINIIVTIFNVVGMFTLIMSSYHYSIDVLCAFIFSSMAWVIYHWAVKNPQLGGSWWGIIINYFDDPFYYDHDSLPIAYDQNVLAPGNITDGVNISNIQKFDTADNIKDIESGSPANEVTLLYEMNKEHQKKVNSQKLNKNSDEEDDYLTEEEKIYKRNSVLSDTSIDNISNLNLNPSLNNIVDVQPFIEEVTKKDKYLLPTFGTKIYKHHSLTSLLSNNSDNNIPQFLNRSSYASSNNISMSSASSINQNISLGNPLTQSPTMLPALPPSIGKVNKDEYSNKSIDSYTSADSKNYKNSNSIVNSQGISPIQPAQSTFEPVRDTISNYSGSGIVKSNSRHDIASINANISNIKSAVQFKSNSIENITIESIHDIHGSSN
ncbi:hypothetical protein BCR36DRAFT_318052 [Piromyces finnis]|uniref:Sphingomyelin synthase-like domain-containing protein n=1 Tax=Piromyces finnis TaxID=1754191 RepID=A0A1Y1VKD5_9FUNG|nr:hypothetical protein BCR36DRAFT_318052 [Piromyces finnis]|eukprot:ORX58544.1 hypothetical protein BCR36DRAFT_318052 [Piromyces finnis]